MRYETPKLDVIKIDVEDVIQTSYELDEDELPGLPISLNSSKTVLDFDY